MGDLAPLPTAAAPSTDELTFASSDLSVAPPALAEKTVTSPHPAPAEHAQPQLGRGSAMFSTDLGKRAPRKLQGPPYAPVIARSNMVLDVVNAAGLWRSKYPYQYLCIFPHAGWKINDLWDDEDIHLETESFCKELLRFIERDNGVRAQKYAQDWSSMHPERLPIVGGDMVELYDKTNPLSIVDKIFVGEESREYPPIFLWHVAHIMRTAMLTVKGAKLVSLGNDNKDPVVHSTTGSSATTNLTATVPTAPLTAVKTSFYEVDLAASTSSFQPIPTLHKSRKPTSTQGHVLNPITSGSHPWTPGYGAHGQYVGGSDPGQPTLRVCKTRAVHSAPGTYNQPMPYVENMPRVPSGLDPRQHAGAPPMMQSPRYDQAHMVMSQPMGYVHPSMVPVTYEQTSVPPGMILGPPQSHGIVHPSVMPPHGMRTPSMTRSYPRQPSSSQGAPHAAPMGDMSNMTYPPGMPPQNFGSFNPNDVRYNQQHGRGNALYDPYDGNNPNFLATGYPNSNGKKSYHSGNQSFNSRQRKTSYPGSRPYQGQYTNDRSISSQMGGKRFPGQRQYLENDRAITQDRDYGCDEYWIGPQNETVNELYLKDLPENVETAEIEGLFYDRIGVKPTSINIKSIPHGPHASRRRHAFVGFPNASIAKQAISIRGAVIRGLTVSITVPRRFFQKTVEVPPRDTVEAGPSSYSRYTGNPNNGEHRSRGPSVGNGLSAPAPATAVNESTSYSPQDARSGTHKKKKGKQPQQGSAAAGSPEARKSKPKKGQESPAKESVTDSTEDTLTGAAQQADKGDDGVSSSDAALQVVLSSEAQTQQPRIDASTTAGAEEVTLSAEAEEPSPLDAIPPDVAAQDAITAESSTSPDQQQHFAATEQLDAQNEQITASGTEGTSEQGSSEQDLVEHAPIEKTPLPTVPSDPEENFSTELNKDSTLTSAQPTNVRTELGTGSDITSQVTASTVSEGAATIDEGPSTPIVSSAKPVVVDSTSMLVVPAAEVSETIAPETKNTTMAPPDSSVAEDPTAVQQYTAPLPTDLTVTEPIKKSGAQHTESLHPFSKASKAQVKKEKEQKKKALKKEREQAEKVKAAKAAAGKAAVHTPSENEDTTKTNGDSTTTVQDEADEASASFPGDKNPVLSSGKAVVAKISTQKPTSTALPSDRVADNRNKPRKRKGKKANTPATHDTDTSEKEGEGNGKQIGGTISTPKETHSVTNAEVKVNLPEDVPALDARSSEPVHADEASRHTDEASSAATEPIRTVTFAEEPSPAVKKKKTKAKKKKKTIAWPDLGFRLKSPNPSWMGPIDMATDVQHYDEIMNSVCDGEDDTDFSWSELPLIEDEMSYDDEELEEGDGDEGSAKDLDAINRRISELSGQQAATPSELAQGAAATSGEPSIVIEGANDHPAIAALETQLAATKEEIKTSMANIAATEAQRAKSAEVQLASSTTAPSKKKKPNNRKNKKKKKATETSQAGDTNEAAEAADAGETMGSTSMTLEDLIDSHDPFYKQLKEIEDTKRGSNESPKLRGGHCDEPQLLRTMEAYFKETQGSGQSKGRKASKHDLYN